MDKNTITGLIVIALLFFGWFYMTKPSPEQVREMQRRDSIAHAEALKSAVLEQQRQAATLAQQDSDSITAKNATSLFRQDSLFAEELVLENNKTKLLINSKGGRISSAELREYNTYDSQPLNLWKEQHGTMGLNFYAGNIQVNTEELIFTPTTQQKHLSADETVQTLNLRAYIEEDKYIEFIYTLAPDSYMVDFQIRTHNLNDVIAAKTNFLTFHWGVNMPQLEKSRKFEDRYTGVYYRFSEDDVENLSLSGDERKDLSTKVKWVAFKQQFFSSILVADDAFSNVTVSSNLSKSDGFLKDAYMEASLPYAGKVEESYMFHFFFGPNSFPVLQQYGNDLDFPDLVDLGWKWLAWINRYLVIPIFDFLESRVTQNYGLIIFLLTLIIKLILFPLTYKSYLSQARMRVLKPQIDEINKRIPADKAMERQQATMKLYKQAGVNPMGGCLPMLFQFPFLVALFWFFPGAIQLRQKSFLWAEDLASYDSVLDLPFTIPFYGSHVSLFCLLMAIVNVIYTVMNQKNQPMNDQMKSMQIVMYLMPVMLLFIFNDYSSGLSYYYFISLLITIIQTWLIRKFVDDQKLLKEMEKAKAKPIKKSKFQQRLEQMQKEQERRAKQKR